MYKAYYINPLIQYEKINFDLVLADDEGILPEQRISKCFCISSTRSVLENVAAADMSRILSELELPPQESLEVNIDLPVGMELS